MAGMRPVIGITCSHITGKRGRYVLDSDYARAVDHGGGIPVILPALAPEPDCEICNSEIAAAILDAIDGLILSGGGDLDPGWFGEDRDLSLVSIDRERDGHEIALVRDALQRDVPVLGICRGMQVVNVAAGGTLFQDIPSQVPGGFNHSLDTLRSRLGHKVQILPGTRLSQVIKDEIVGVNSFHHQSVKQLAPGFVASAVSEDGVIEGMESRDHRFVVCVQWHPENMFERFPVFGSLFESLVVECRGRGEVAT